MPFSPTKKDDIEPSFCRGDVIRKLPLAIIVPLWLRTPWRITSTKKENRLVLLSGRRDSEIAIGNNRALVAKNTVENYVYKKREPLGSLVGET